MQEMFIFTLTLISDFIGVRIPIYQTSPIEGEEILKKSSLPWRERARVRGNPAHVALRSIFS
jgi:hypothetical protein